MSVFFYVDHTWPVHMREPTLDKSKKILIKYEKNQYFFQFLCFETEMACKISELSEKNEE
jgi:hypothetical protein